MEGTKERGLYSALDSEGRVLRRWGCSEEQARAAAADVPLTESLVHSSGRVVLTPADMNKARRAAARAFDVVYNGSKGRDERSAFATARAVRLFTLANA